MEDTSGTDAYCELSFSPNASLISTVRRFVGEFYQRVLGDADLTSRLEVATHELLENAVRYSADAQSTIRVAVKREAGEIDVVIDTRNRARMENVGELKQLLEELHGSSDRAGFYQVLMKRTAKRKVGSGLGLGRIFAESELDLSARFEEDIVHLRASGRFPSSQGGSS
jgi:anti-sigma regulatory factor (Ser/Thr protein kinase)